MEKLLEKIKEISNHRKGIPQFLYLYPIFGDGVLRLRKSIIEFKIKNPEVKELDFIIQSPGGLADDAYRIIRTLRKNFATVNIIVPFWAKSASTLLSFGGTKIVMDEFGEFGPLDAQVVKSRDDSPEYDRESALNDEHSLSMIETRFKVMFESMFIRLYESKRISIAKNTLSEQLLSNISKFYEPLLEQIDPYKLGEKRRTLDIGTQYARRVLTQYHPSLESHKVRELVEFLINGCPDHGYIIDYDLLSKFIDFVETSEKFGGLEYASTLRDISMILTDMEEPGEFVGFVDENQESNHLDNGVATLNEDIIPDLSNKEVQIALTNELDSNEQFGN